MLSAANSIGPGQQGIRDRRSGNARLAGIHFEVKKGEYLSIAGPSGCGKSTLLAILGLLDTPSDGIYYLNGKPVTGLKLSERARIRNREIGFIFQAFKPDRRPSPSTRTSSCR